MKKSIFFPLFIFIFFIANHLSVQGQENINMNQSIKKTCSAYFYDEGGPSNNYNKGSNIIMRLEPSTAVRVLQLTINEMDLNDDDTLWVYDGGSTQTSPPFYFKNRYNENTPFITVDHNISRNPSFADTKIRATNKDGYITFKFKSSIVSSTAKGWKMFLECILPCQKVEIKLDDTFDKLVNGERVSVNVKQIKNERGDIYNTIDFCNNDTIIVRAKGTYGSPDFYNQSDATSTFTWTTGIDNVNNIVGIGTNELQIHYPRGTGYNLGVSLKDTMGCAAPKLTTALIRIANNPVSIIKTIPDLCTKVPYTLGVGAGATDAILVNDKPITVKTPLFYDKLRWLPNAAKNGNPHGCYERRCNDMTVTFAGFPDTETIKDSTDIISFCMNAEHTMVGNLVIALICPNGQKTVLKYYSNSGCDAIPEVLANGYSDPNYCVEYGTSLTSLGAIVRQVGEAVYPTDPYTKYCDSSLPRHLPTGGGLYCFSEKYNAAEQTYGLMNDHIVTEAQKPQTDTLNKKKYYIPNQSFSTLVGCPLNGDWTLRICDYHLNSTSRNANGYLHNWSVQLSDRFSSTWSYKVPIDTVAFEGDYLSNWKQKSVNITPEEPGEYTISAQITDNFNCTWDTAAHVTVIKSPIVSFGASDTTICENIQLKLDAQNENATYLWEPFGDTTSSIKTKKDAGNLTYKVLVTHVSSDGKTVCSALDTIRVFQRVAPMASFLPSDNKIPIEGCEPHSVAFTSTSPNADKYEWYFGDGATSDSKNPSHTYKRGLFDLKFIAINNNGCTDTAFYPELIEVFSSPVPDFLWTPQYPSSKIPVAHFINKTVPQSEQNIYEWRIPKVKESTDYNYFDSVNVTYDFSKSGESNFAGKYPVMLFVKTDNMAKSGLQYVCKDSITKDVVVLNDFLQFPNVVTANGDGVNDVFKIVNLVDGMAYPNNELFIYDRWGRKVYHKKNINLESDFWDPKSEGIPSGTYFYKFVGKGFSTDVEYKGAIEVLVN